MAPGVLTMSRLLLGEELKRLRADSGKTLDDLAAVIGKGRARLINVLDGRGTLTAEELGKLLDFLGIPEDQRTKLLALGTEARKRPSPRSYSDLLPAPYERLADLESVASELCCYERGVIPGLLQTPEYIEALMADAEGIWWRPSFNERHNRIMFRLERQRLAMEDPNKTLRFVIAEEALLTEVGGPKIITAQLRYILSVVDRPNVHVRVLSSTVAHNPSPGAGLTLVRLGADRRAIGLLPVVFGPSIYIDDPVDTGRLSRAFDKIEQLAMSAHVSKQLIEDLVKGYAVDSRHRLVQEHQLRRQR
jgi:transcriptional regulator with XRE-family HTH domain